VGVELRDEKELLSWEDKELLDENSQLTEARLCKVCLDKAVPVVFTPCGHLVCCTECAEPLQTCPICRKDIQGMLKTFLS